MAAAAVTLRLGSGDASVCVVGRSEFNSGLGLIAGGLAETWARAFPVCYLPTDAGARGRTHVTLPSGRVLPICRDPGQVAVSAFCDLLSVETVVPPGRLRYAVLPWPSDRLPLAWVERLHGQFDAVLLPSTHLADVMRANGVRLPLQHLPVPLELEAALARHVRRPGAVLRFGTIGSLDPRKGLPRLVAAFAERFGADPAVELIVHGNVAFGTLPEVLHAMATPNVRITGADLSSAALAALLDEIDVFVTGSAGEGAAIGPILALARGKPVVASAIGGHAELFGPPGVFAVSSDGPQPAYFPELRGSYGWQRAPDQAALGDALAAAAAFARDDAGRTAGARRAHAARWSIAALVGPAAGLIDPSIPAFRGETLPTPEIAALAETRLGRRARAIAGPRRQVCAAHDGGFFSVFNTYMSHLVWQRSEDRCHAVLPDWDVDRFLSRLEAPVLSFCYGQPGDGNLWTRLFQPLFGATEAEMSDPDFLWEQAELPPDRHNEAREPLLTYVRAAKLYASPDFAHFRRQYHAAFARHVRLRPEHQAEIDAFAAAHLTAPILIAAHVRHPSHTVEQPTGRIASASRYVDAVRDAVRRRGADPDGEGWAVFVATDQERVLRQFREAFGPRAVFFPDARRTRADEDAAFDALSPAEQNRDGHQLQHLVAADRASWHWRMAWEVVRDAYAMARCHTLLHVVSNVSTAVSYMNPAIDMVFCEP